ncbi:phosphoribosylaminoimidazole-succinocarboxamide synthase [Exiguobacterium sp. Leaf187]|uniref:Phosphoribosylaminoimidazole-succinocarboxamide synthase n=2 Tax=Bacteria TaxID=2 RepID=A0ABU8ELC2_9BACL|nr:MULTISPECIES: phosphoribosylaminoimidazolesuccinocarboxamide synthase [Exiguobacterium]AHA28768.1 phosphoribosylaminoimidazole-succinocarboxamide synthase [Exiguobacterium sp. MH3]KNH31876.1 phosphoribosylaminoimidazole-succinocarboxamide synthase [Exiguobacterium acetylicum]KQS21534.1 phosphoribosylaminoimidazole-succinocarboxamide synthase [Exiguobacterium sp. Leaf187]MCQ4091999.1 phosphoribosylaminoimidazolesuccinocarboxamide synthase [Exiguobacterium sp. LL15]NTY08415.1 phosphoribosylam
MQPLYEGKAKRLYTTQEQDVLRIVYKDEATAFNGEKKEVFAGKGELNNRLTSHFFEILEQAGIPTHFIERVSEREQLVRRVTIIPLEVVVRNVVAGSLSKRLGIEEGTVLETPIVEFYYKDDTLGDPLVTSSHINLLKIATSEELKQLSDKALRVNEVLQPYFRQNGITLIDFKLEYGKMADGTILLADEISPDTCRLWDQATGEHLDKDVFRRNIGSLTETYQTLFNRLGGNTQ